MKPVITSLLLLLVSSAPCAAQGADTVPPARRAHDAGMTLSSTAFPDGGVLPDAFTMKAGQDAPSPPLTWSQPPAGTQSLALIMHDMDVVVDLGDGTHWLAVNIPATATSLPEGVAKTAQLADGTIQPLNRRIHGYFPPGAPPAFYHHYVIELYALDRKLQLDEQATRGDMVKAMEGHVLDRAVLFFRSHL